MLIHSSPVIRPLESAAAHPVGFNSAARELALTRNVPIKPVQASEKPLGNQSQDSKNALTQLSGGVQGGKDDSAESAKKVAETGKNERLEQRRLDEQRREIIQLAARDREVRAHEQAHMAVGGQYAGAATYQFERGPDGINYAIGGEVPISSGAESTPQATIRKAQIVRRAALAPADPSPQDRQVAAQASKMEASARKELAEQNRQEALDAAEKETDETDAIAPEDNPQALSAKEERSASESRPIGGLSQNEISSFPRAGATTGEKLIRTIANASLNSHTPGSLVQQIV